MSYIISDHRAGDTWRGINRIVIYRNGSPLDLNDASAKMQVRVQHDSPPLVEFNSINNTILFTLPLSSGEFSIPPQLVDIPAGNYRWDLELTLSSGEIKTFAAGTWRIISDITQS